MLKMLQEAADALPDLLTDAESWNTLQVTYNLPYVDRLWRNFGEGRILLHRIHPCGEDEALFHPHPWPAAIRVLGPGDYEMGIAWGDPTGPVPPMATKITMTRGGLYEMTDPRAWHYVRPLHREVFSLMVIGKPYDTPKQERFGQFKEHRPLNDHTKHILLNFFRSYSPPKTH
jgi:hypothetical protein